MKTAIFSAIAASVLAFSGVQNLSATLPATAAIDKTVEATINANVAAYEKAFNSGDAPAMARMWAADGSYINTDGWVSTGRDQLEKFHAKLFAGKPAGKLKISIGSLTESGPDAIVERGVGALVDDRGDEYSRTPYIAIHRRNGSEWLLQTVVEMSPDALRARISDLSWMLGTWKAGTGQNSVALSNKLQPGGKVMVSDFEVTDGKGVAQHEMMITTLNPETGKLNAFIFDANGGYGRGVWSQAQGNWYLNSHRVKPDGTTLDATHVLSRSSDSTLKWRTVGRTVDGVVLSDVPDVTVTRISSSK